jgi:DNA (cytosine-5)-methyltransferase 1
MKKPIGVVDLFCGIGGLSYGLKQSGIDIVAGIDADGSCKYAFEENNNTVFLHKNVTEVKGIDIKRLLREYETKILVGCAPCQPFSNHRKDKKDRKGHKDWSLLYHFARIVKESTPHIVSMENVPALVKEKVFEDFVKALEEQKYIVEYAIVNVADYGVPQRRRRLILTATKKWKYPKGISLIPVTHKGNWVTVREKISKLPVLRAGELCEMDRLHISSQLSEINLRRIHASIPGGTWRDWPEDLLTDCHQEETGKSYSSVYGRMCWDDVSPTMTTQFIGYGTGRFGHPEQNRALTLREGALLQSFPQDYKFVSDDEVLSLKAVARHIGNAVPPRLGEVIGESILQVVTKKGRKK